MPRPPHRPPFPLRRHLVASLTVAALLLLSACRWRRRPRPRHPGHQATSAPSRRRPPPPDHRPAPRAGDPREPTGEPVTLAFGGDVHFEGAIESRLAANPATTLGPIAEVLRRADLAVVNLETAITERGTPAPKDFTFRAPPPALTALKEAGVDVATMANNHGLDFGQVGLRDSLAAAKAARFPVVGVGRNADEAYRAHQVTVKGQRIAVIGATQVLDSSLAAAWTAGDGKPGMASAYEEARLLAAVRAARRSADTVVVDLHWGRELVRLPDRPPARPRPQAGRGRCRRGRRLPRPRPPRRWLPARRLRPLRPRQLRLLLPRRPHRPERPAPHHPGSRRHRRPLGPGHHLRRHPHPPPGRRRHPRRQLLAVPPPLQRPLGQALSAPATWSDPVLLIEQRGTAASTGLAGKGRFHGSVRFRSSVPR